MINSYFPCDPRTDNFDDSELITLLADLRSVIQSSECNNVLLAGDLNSHFDRQSRFTNLVDNELADLGLVLLWQNTDNNPHHWIQPVDYTYLSVSNNVASCSTIDHFGASHRMYTAVKEAGVIHSGENLSNHSAIYLKIRLGDIELSMDEPRKERMVSWQRASDDDKDNFKYVMQEKFQNLNLPACASCQDLACTIHTDEMEEYTMTVLEAVESASKECLPSTGGGGGGKVRKEIVPGWTELVKPYADESKFWKSIWTSEGEPRGGQTFENMKYSKRQYKYAVRRLKRCNDTIQNNKFLAGVLDGGSDIFAEIRKFRGKSTTFSSRIDDEVGSKNIASHFAGIYSDLYNRVENGAVLDQVSERINSGINTTSKAQLDRIDENLIKSALKKMKSNKRDAVFDTVSDCYSNGPPELVFHLTKLVRMYLSHGNVPYFILLCTLLPLVKDKFGDITSSDNYRAIAGGCLMLKLLDIVILLLEGDKLSFSELQFAYQANVSTTVCSWAVTSVIDHFNRKGAAVYGAAMDMSKAFDMVEWGELFTTLLDRKVDCLFLRMMLFIYRNQSCDVKWCGEYSHRFTVSNGVRQGAVSSAFLFSVYIDKLLLILKKSRLGCHIDSVFYGAFIFADDIFLLSASRSGLQSLVNICQEFAASKNLKFGTNPNPDKSKTKCIVFSKKAKDHLNLAKVTLDGVPLPWVRKVVHLGCTLESDNSMKTDVAQKRGKFIGKVNSLMQEFHFASSGVMVKLLNVYTTSFYGSSLWDLLSADCERIYKSWNVTVRNIFNLDRTTHRYMIEPMSGCLHPKVMLASRFINFHKALVNSSKFCVRYLARLAERDMRTVMGRTLHYLLEQCGLNTNQLEELSPGLIKKSLKYAQAPEGEEWRIHLALELKSIRAEPSTLDGFTITEVEEMLKFTCTT